LVRAFPGAKLSYIPAYPEAGRTVRGGSVLIHGVPAHLSDLAHDALNPISTSSITELLGPDLPCTIHDGETVADVRVAVAAALSVPGPHIIAGPASVAAALAAHLQPETLTPRWPRVNKCLVVGGSRHPASLAQIRHAIQRGCLSTYCTAPWREYAFAESKALTPNEFASALGISLTREVDLTAPDAVMVFGGDTAFGILEAMNRPDLEPIGEILTGVPISRIAGRRVYLITKAGSFGEQDVICQLKGLLNGPQ
jgi:D-threonate/D-erythronate kinase